MFTLATQIHIRMDNRNAWPKALEPYRHKLQATEKPFVRIILYPDPSLQPWQSKIGGVPYLPKGIPFPVNQEGEQLFFLGQVNFAEVPSLPGFPAQGILQFYIFDDGLYGMNPDDPEAQHNFRVLFYPEPQRDPGALLADFSFLRKYGDLPLDSSLSLGMGFEAASGLMPEADFRFDDLFGEDFFGRFGAEEWSVAEAYNHISDAAGHRIGGYAEFTQEDPRSPEDPMELLFQIDTDSKNGIRWGDMGVANFFIRPQDLEQRNFARVLYHWDCY